MLSANFKPKRTAAASRGFLATARLSCYKAQYTAWLTVVAQCVAGILTINCMTFFRDNQKG